MKAMYLVSALALSAFAFAPAQAAPVAPVNGVAVQQSIVLAQYHGKGGRNNNSHNNNSHNNRGHNNVRYVPGHRYSSAPHGWHRYSRRPGDWNRRGCVLVGPIWFCP